MVGKFLREKDRHFIYHLSYFYYFKHNKLDIHAKNALGTILVLVVCHFQMNLDMVSFKRGDDGANGDGDVDDDDD